MIRQCYFLQTIAILKCFFSNACQAFRQHNLFQVPASGKSLPANICDTVWKNNASQTSAICKSAVPDLSQTFRQFNQCQLFAVQEHSLTYLLHTFRQCDCFQFTTVAKCPCPNLCHFMPIHLLRYDHFFFRSFIPFDSYRPVTHKGIGKIPELMWFLFHLPSIVAIMVAVAPRLVCI